MAIIYSPEYEVDLGGHVFPAKKYRLIKTRLIKDRIAVEKDFSVPGPASDKEITLVHTPGYLHKIKTLSLSSSETARLEMPLTAEIARAAALACGGTILAGYLAVEYGIGLHCGGGFHHAFPDHGEGFCVFNDIAVGIRVMQKSGKINRAMVIDCDLHQGNGTAHVFRDDPSVFTFSIHQEDIYPAVKPPGSLDVGVESGTGDAEYLDILKQHIPRILDSHRPEFIIYQAGADPYEGDQLGGLKLTIEGLKERDKIVFEQCAKRGIAVVVTLGGGYASNVEDTVTIHANTFAVFLKSPVSLV